MKKSLFAAMAAAVLTLSLAGTAMAAQKTAGSWKQDEKGNWYYFNEEGVAVTGFLNDGGHIYYLSPEEGEERGKLITEDGSYQNSGLVFNKDHNGCFGEIIDHSHVYEVVVVYHPGKGHYSKRLTATKLRYACGYHENEFFDSYEEFERHALDDVLIKPTVLSYSLKSEDVYESVWVEEPGYEEQCAVCVICGDTTSWEAGAY